MAGLFVRSEQRKKVKPEDGPQPGAQSWRLAYQPQLQGVRAIAVLAVFAFHVGELPGGWLGVEIFFVLSGFLISSILLGESVGRDVRLGRFYMRRAARLLPAVLLFFVVVIVFSQLVDLDVEDSRRAAFASVFYYANWGEVAGWNFAGLGHMWSLSIEEQFYLLWPLVLIVVVRRRGAVGVAIASGVGLVASSVLRVTLTQGDDWQNRVQYGSDSRSAALFIGCLAAAMLFSSRGSLGNRLPRHLGWALVVPIGAALVMLAEDSQATWQWWITAFDIAVVLVVLTLVDSTSSLARLLSWPPAVYVGEISYGLYLWHFGVIWAAGNSDLGSPAIRMAVQVIVPFILAAASYHWLERPIRAWARRREQIE